MKFLLCVRNRMKARNNDPPPRNFANHFTPSQINLQSQSMASAPRNHQVGTKLQGRSTQLHFNGSTSQSIPTPAGVPQGSPLPPFLYMYYNADLLEATKDRLDTMSLAASSSIQQPRRQSGQCIIASMLDRIDQSMEHHPQRQLKII
jgi:hypothetical protein